MSKYKQWTAPEQKRLAEFVKQGKTRQECAELLGRTLWSVTGRGCKLGLNFARSEDSYKNRQKLSDKEVRKIRKLSKKMTCAEVHRKHFPQVSKGFVRAVVRGDKRANS